MNEFDRVPPGHRDDDPWTSKEADQAVRVTARNQRGKLLLSYFKDHYGLSQGLTDEQAATIGLTDPAEAMLLVVANPGEGGTTVNLLAPVVVNARTAVGTQFILEDQDLPLRAELAAR